MGIIRDMQRAHATQAAAEHRAGTAASQQRELIRRNADLAIAAAQQAASDAARKREHRRLYVEARSADAAAANADLRGRLSDLDALLASTLDVDDHIDLDRFKKPAAMPPFDPGRLGRPIPPPSWDSYEPAAPSGIVKLLGERQHQQQISAARRAFSISQQRWAEAEERRKRQLTERKQAYEASKVQVRRQDRRKYNAEVDRFAAAVAASEPESVVEYFAMVLGNSVYPDDFPQHFRLAFQPKRRQLLIEYHLPPIEVIPIVKEYRYDQTRDDLVADAPRRDAEVRRRYTRDHRPGRVADGARDHRGGPGRPDRAGVDERHRRHDRPADRPVRTPVPGVGADRPGHLRRDQAAPGRPHRLPETPAGEALVESARRTGRRRPR